MKRKKEKKTRPRNKAAPAVRGKDAKSRLPASSHPAPTSSKKEFSFGLFEIGAMVFISLLIWLAAPMFRPLEHWSYLGAFILAFLSSVSVFIPTGPLQFFIISLGRNHMLNPIGLGIAAGIGSGLGELSGYVVGLGSSHLLRAKNKTVRWLMALQTGILRRWAGIGIFVLSALPNPLFDFAGIAAGLMGMKWYEFLFWCVAGRIVRFIFLAYAGAWSVAWL